MPAVDPQLVRVWMRPITRSQWRDAYRAARMCRYGPVFHPPVNMLAKHCGLRIVRQRLETNEVASALLAEAILERRGIRAPSST